ncbi:MAG: hypothetical protein HWD58_16485 [Bacteroidota bacterium]|nr:MAG: hypothetical protein HWD58_16485 [Bacteroidota bacterium]
MLIEICLFVDGLKASDSDRFGKIFINNFSSINVSPTHLYEETGIHSFCIGYPEKVAYRMDTLLASPGQK